MSQAGIPQNLLRYFDDTINQISPFLHQDYLIKKKAVSGMLHRLLVVSNENWLEYQNTGSFGSKRLGVRRRLEQNTIKRELLSLLCNALRERYEIYQMQKIYWNIDILGSIVLPLDRERDRRTTDDVDSRLDELMESRPVQRHIQSTTIKKIYNDLLVHLFVLKDAQHSYDWIQTTSRAQFKKSELFTPAERKAYKHWLTLVADKLISQPTDVNKCSICLEACTSGSGCVLPCHHMFHQECIATWKKVNPICPLCRVPIPNEVTVCTFV